MGQARLRGTKDERVRAALDGKLRVALERERREMENELARARRWAEMAPEEQAAALEKAKAHARNYGQLQELFGHDVAMALAPLM